MNPNPTIRTLVEQISFPASIHAKDAALILDEGQPDYERLEALLDVSRQQAGNPGRSQDEIDRWIYAGVSADASDSIDTVLNLPVRRG